MVIKATHFTKQRLNQLKPLKKFSKEAKLLNIARTVTGVVSNQNIIEIEYVVKWSN